MNHYLSVAEVAKKWNVSKRTVRNYCANNRIPGAFLTGKTWNIPKDAVRPKRLNSANKEPKTLLEHLSKKEEGSIYHRVQIELTYHSNHIEGSQLSQDQTRHIFETNTIGLQDTLINVDDVIETANHFRCVDSIIDHAKKPLTPSYIKELHRILKSSTKDDQWAGNYKIRPNEVGGIETTPPKEVANQIKDLLLRYNAKQIITLDDLLAFHVAFERIHPFQDGNGRIGRLILFKECLNHDIVPFIIDERHRYFYYRGLKEWDYERGFLRDTCLSAQDIFKQYLDYFEIPYKK